MMNKEKAIEIMEQVIEARSDGIEESAWVFLKLILERSDKSDSVKSCFTCGLKECIYFSNPVSDNQVCEDWE